jgi:hypothetical protein
VPQPLLFTAQQHAMTRRVEEEEEEGVQWQGKVGGGARVTLWGGAVRWVKGHWDATGSWKLVLHLIALLVQKVQIVTRPKALLAESLAARAVTLMLSARV